MSPKYKLGFTYIEMLIVMALIGVISSFTLAMNLNNLFGSSIITERNLLVTLVLYKIRAESLANINESDHGVHIDNDKKEYVVFSGSNYDLANITNIKIPFSSQKISVIINPAKDIIFKAVSGNTISSSTIIIQSNNKQAEININLAGQINW